MLPIAARNQFEPKDVHLASRNRSLLRRRKSGKSGAVPYAKSPCKWCMRNDSCKIQDPGTFQGPVLYLTMVAEFTSAESVYISSNVLGDNCAVIYRSATHFFWIMLWLDVEDISMSSVAAFPKPMFVSQWLVLPAQCLPCSHAEAKSGCAWSKCNRLSLLSTLIQLQSSS